MRSNEVTKRPEINLLRAMEVFMAVAEQRQVTAAAAALGLTQSAASQHLKNLEQAFDITLIDRTRRPLTLTHAGEVMARRAFRVMSEVQDLRADLQRLSATTIPFLRIGILASLATTLTSDLTRLVSDEFAIPELSLSAGLATDHQRALAARQVDMVVTSDPQFDLTGFENYPILREPFFLVLPPDYEGPAGNIEGIARTLPFVRFNAETPVGRRTDQHIQRLRLDLPRGMAADRASMVVAGVAAGRGFAILTPGLLIDALAEGMRFRIEPLPVAGFSRNVQLICRRGEFGDMPGRVAALCAGTLRTAFEAHLPVESGACSFADREY